MSLITSENVAKYKKYQDVKKSITGIKRFIEEELPVINELKKDSAFLALLDQKDIDDIIMLDKKISDINVILKSA
jgi:hypothetical protein